MRIITRKKPAFTDLYQTGVLTRIAAVKTDTGGWRLFGVWRDQDVAALVEAARGGIRGIVRLKVSGGVCVQLRY